MLKKHNQLFLTFMSAADIFVVVASWFGAYYFRFTFYEAPKGVPPISLYATALFAIIPVWAVSMQMGGLYKQMRSDSRFDEYFRIAYTSTIAVVIMMAMAFFYREYTFSRIVILMFWGFCVFGLVTSHSVVRAILRRARAKGYNLRYVLIVGAGELGQALAEKFAHHPESGLKVVGLLGDSEDEVGKKINGYEVIGVIDQLKEKIDEHNVDQIFIALPSHLTERLEKTMSLLDEETVDVKLAPDILQYISLSGGVEDFEGIPIISLTESPMYGWNRAIKLLFDFIFSIIFLIIASPAMIAIAIAIKLESEGPVIYCQRRMSMDGNPFTLYKFRSMKIGAEDDTGAVWATKDDNRKTKIGEFIRKTSLDEFPQLFNVIKGQMSLVGPRPERPEFVEKFKSDIPKYMLRHKVKSGITGWAQVNGWRGSTSLVKRIEYDLYYIENWSLLLDIKIIWLTLWKGFINDHAY